MNREITLIASFTLVIDQIIKYLFSSVIKGFVLIPNFISFIYAIKNITSLTGTSYILISKSGVWVNCRSTLAAF